MFRAHVLWYYHTYRCDDTRGCVMQFWPPDDELMCSKHVEAWNETYCKTKFCAWSWLNTEINILRCKVSLTSKNKIICEVEIQRDITQMAPKFPYYSVQYRLPATPLVPSQVFWRGIIHPNEGGLLTWNYGVNLEAHK